MAEVMVLAGSAGLLAAGSLAWYTMWHRRTAALKRVPVATARSAGARRPGAERRGGAV